MIKIEFQNLILKGDSEKAFRDPACFYHNGVYHLFYTLSRKKNGYMYNRVAKSESRDLKNWSEPEFLTKEDNLLNFCSPGNILKVNDEFIMCVSSYPMPLPFEEVCAANDNARLFIMRSRDLKTWSEPEKIHISGEMSKGKRKIDPFIIEDKDISGKYHLFFKLDGKINRAVSNGDLFNWEYVSDVIEGENPCIVVENDKYMMFYSPTHGIEKLESDDLCSWKEKGKVNFDDETLEWATGRITAGFMMNMHHDGKKALFFHSSVLGAFPETHGDASIGLIKYDI